jgi:hypothetical protein
MVGNFTALALTVVLAALVVTTALCFFAFEMMKFTRARARREAPNCHEWATLVKITAKTE